MTKAKVADFLVEVLLKTIMFAAVLVIAPVALDNYYGHGSIVDTNPWPEHQGTKDQAGSVVLPWLNGWGGVAFPSETGTTAR